MRKRVTSIGTAALLLLALALHYHWLQPHLEAAGQDFDAVHLYLPLAHQLVEQGLAFFADERSIRAPAFSYFYPALLGGSLATIKVVNGVLSGLTLLLVFRTAWLLHSRIAGIAAALLFAVSPLLRPFLVAPITEAPFLLLNALWFWGLCEWMLSGRRICIVVSAIALGLAALTRGTIFYWIPLLIAAYLLLAWRSEGELRRRARGSTIAYSIALVLPVIFIVKNILLFGFPFFATGAGNALYLGNNPVTGGYDPGYLGLLFDVGAIARDQSPLTLEAERLLGAVGRMVISEQSVPFLLAMHAKKLAAFLFVTSAEPNSIVLRSWRIALVILAVPGLLAITNRWLGLTLLGILTYGVAVHVPVLYTHRYSVGALDLWLVIAAGIGMAALLVSRNPVRIAAVAILVSCGIALGGYFHKHAGPPAPDIFRAARMAVWYGSAFKHSFGPGRERIEFSVRDAPRFHPWNHHALVIEALVSPARETHACRSLQVSYKRDKDPDFSAVVERRVREDGITHRYQMGAVPLNLNAEGILRLEMHCATDTTLNVSRLAIYAPVGAFDYRERFLGEPPLFPFALDR